MPSPTPQPTVLPPTEYSVQNCTEVSIYCPIPFTIYGYEPNMGANAFFCAFFGVCALVQLFAGIKYKTWTYLIALLFGALGEAIGYVGRIMLHNNAWDSNGFQVQICCLIIAPAFITAGIYLTLKHIVLEVGPEFSRIKPRMYTWIFIPCDIFSLVLQAIGGALAATAKYGDSMQKTGNDLMMAGIVWQVITLLVFGLLVFVYAISARSSMSPVKRSGKFKLFAASLFFAYLTIFVRCVYRIAEMAGGWGNSIMQNEPEFIVLDSVMIMIAVLCLTVTHPGWAFPEMQMHGKTGPMSEFTAADREKVAGTGGVLSPTGSSPAGSVEKVRPAKKGMMARIRRS